MVEIIKPGPGQESVWDYPRPPQTQPVNQTLKVVFNGEVIAETTRGLRVLERGLAPTYYFPREDVRMDLLTRTDHTTLCKYTGLATYYSVTAGGKMGENIAWSYEDPKPEYPDMRGYLAFFPARVDACYVDGEKAQPQHARYYGGWITASVVGPFAGDPGVPG
ncbi:MAG: DUF427 domain-containing protein [Phototrophicaceae bacterium]